MMRWPTSSSSSSNRPPATIDDFVILYDTGTSDPNNPTGFAVVLMSDGNLNVYPQDGQVFDTDPMTDAAR